MILQVTLECRKKLDAVSTCFLRGTVLKFPSCSHDSFLNQKSYVELYVERGPADCSMGQEMHLHWSIQNFQGGKNSDQDPGRDLVIAYKNHNVN